MQSGSTKLVSRFSMRSLGCDAEAPPHVCSSVYVSWKQEQWGLWQQTTELTVHSRNRNTARILTTNHTVHSASWKQEHSKDSENKPQLTIHPRIRNTARILKTNRTVNSSSWKQKHSKDSENKPHSEQFILEPETQQGFWKQTTQWTVHPRIRNTARILKTNHTVNSSS